MVAGGGQPPPATRQKGGLDYRYYRCVTRDKEGSKACPSGPLSADAIEAFIVDRLRGATGDGSLARDVQKKLQGNIEAQRALAALDQTEIETQWVVESLTHFDAVWEAMNLENRGRLVRAIVEKVEVDEPSGQVTAVLLDLDLGDDPEPPATDDTEKAEVRA